MARAPGQAKHATAPDGSTEDGAIAVLVAVVNQARREATGKSMVDVPKSRRPIVRAAAADWLQWIRAELTDQQPDQPPPAAAGPYTGRRIA